RIAPIMRSSQAVAASRDGGTTQLEFSFPKSHAHSASWPSSALAASRARRACASAIEESVYQLPIAIESTLPPATTRKRPETAFGPSAHPGIQLTPLMCPVKRVRDDCKAVLSGQLGDCDQIS